MSAAYPLTFLSLQKAEPHKQVVAPTNEERLQAFRRFAPVVHTNNNFFPQSRPPHSPTPLGAAAPFLSDPPGLDESDYFTTHSYAELAGGF